MTSVDTDPWSVVHVLNRYPQALDWRQWEVLDQVFHQDATADYGTGRLQGRVAIVAMIRGMLGGCGPSQHLLGNHQVEIDGESARSTCRCRVFHQGAGGRQQLTYEVLGAYDDELAWTEHGWRITHRVMSVSIQRGDPSILGPEER
jgi:hypothetical protein